MVIVAKKLIKGESFVNFTPLSGVTAAQIATAVQLHCSTTALEGSGHFDLANIAVMGHSMGSEVVLQTLNTNSDFKIGIAMMLIAHDIPADRPTIQKPIELISRNKLSLP